MNIRMQLFTISLGDMRPSGPSSCTSFEIMPSVGFFSDALDELDEVLSSRGRASGGLLFAALPFFRGRVRA